MKRLLIFSYIGLIVPFLISCDSELVAPAGAAQVQTQAAYGSCRTYQYISKGGEETNYGAAYGEVLLVGFREGMTLKEKEKLVRQSSLYKSIAGEVAMESGLITLVQLKPRSTCADVELLRDQLQRHPDVLFANPAFKAQPGQEGEVAWLGLSNEFLVFIEPGTQAQLEALVAQTNSTLVFSLSEELHLISVTKTSQGDALALSNLFNQQAFVVTAEPNFVLQAVNGSMQDAASQTVLKKMKQSR
ncbi:hypothetical protein GU926_01025 [Nibribacter ruber]|uniref:Uncharacterized protein n=1 Tax=Nibribacter ruber TaxID=2698458 RepID=A0A6P1NYY0_9BACT|nr:hypothetical protein [Nibribacter ruber]QHL86103.1 hypothetical protein GU926_01025 [Nibribacter ruber]